ncbi:PepSY-associated TM helix domain-containing protein [Aestuariicella sp. G3-2]|uniref:PepSY-associated TM helix domain-containing protein n=1 Tax=Pseudomaricurvus albidus TaxID=2842452 RepID=UPI001C0E593C|nr:PepSY-associated TM helix domain-containing protein [Aestuariicella albida]MBU3069783.1 PepSY-associated TM helix domain-containing protein [Aestuariicella albida]
MKTSNNRPPRPKSRLLSWRPFFWRWHRRLGVVAALIVVVVSITGFLLNHTSDLGLGSLPVRQAWLLQHYGVKAPELTSFSVGDGWLSGDDQGYVYLNGQQAAQCRQRLVGGVLTDRWLVVACSHELLLLTPDGDLLERLGETYELPVPLSAIGQCSGEVCLNNGQTVQADLEQVRWEPREDASVDWSRPAALPDELRDRLMHEQLGVQLSWERVMLDLHSGRIGGRLGVWLVDLAAILLLFLAFSGFMLWYQQWRRKHRW